METGTSIQGVNYLDDLLNEMTKESFDDEDEGHDYAITTSVTASTSKPSHKQEPSRPESFRGDFDYLEALLNDIGPMEPPAQQHNQPQHHHQQDNAAPHTAAHQRPSSAAPHRASAMTAAFDLESTLKDLEDTFYNGGEGGVLKRTTSVVHWPDSPAGTPKRDDYMDVLDELVGMNFEDKSPRVDPAEKPPSSTSIDEDTSVLDRMIHSFSATPEEKGSKQQGVPVLPNNASPTAFHNNEPTSPRSIAEDDISYLDQMLNAFIAEPTAPIIQPKAKANKPKGVQVLPAGPIPTLKQTEPLAEVPQASKDTTSPYKPRRPHSRVCPPIAPAPTEPSRITRAPIPAAATTPAPAKIPALRSTATFTTFGRATINMDDLLDQVIHSIVTDEASPNAPTPVPAQSRQSVQHPHKPPVAPPATEDDELLGQILSNQELNMSRLERVAQGSAAKDWMVPFSELEPFLQSKLGVGNHGEAYRPGIWRGTKVVVKRWNTSLSLSPPLIEELSTLVSLHHPHLVPIIGACGDGRGIYTLTEYIPGANLHGFLHNGGLSGEKDSTVTILRIARQVAEAMAYLHALGIPHRSLAPKNVLLDNRLSAHLRDYGLATLKDDVWTTQRASNPRFPLYDSQYVAPELMRGAQYSMQVDVYSFGVLLWEAFAGESAHDGLVLRELHGCPFSVQKLIKLCVSATPSARPSFATVVKILSQPMETLLKYARPPSAIIEPGFFNQNQASHPSHRVSLGPTHTHPHSHSQPHSQPHGRLHAEPQEPVEEDRAAEAEEDKKLQRVLYAIADLIRTPSDQAQLKAVHAIENLAQKAWNVTRMIAHGFVPHVVDLLRSKFVEVQETAARVIAGLLKNPEFCQNFLRSNGTAALLDLLAGPDDGVRLVAAKALTVAAYTTPDLTRSDVHVRGGGAALAALLRVDNEFVRVQTAWALGQLLVPGHPLVDSFFAADGVPLLASLLITGGSPAAELRALGALLPLLATPHARAMVPSSVPRKVALLMSAPQPPLRAQALQAVTLLAADRGAVPILLEGHGLSVALLALIQPPFDNPLLLPTLDLLRNIAETQAHAAMLVRAGLREALHPHLASEDSNIVKSAHALYNLLI